MNAIVEIEEGAIAAVAKVGPDEARTRRKAEALVALAESIEVKTQEDYNLAAGELRTIIAFHGQLEEERTGFTKPMNDLLTKMNARFMPYLKALRGDGKKETVSAESIIKGKMAAFLTEQQRLADEERARAERAAQAERDRLAAEAEALRKKAEEEAAEQRRQEEARQAEARAAQKKLDDAAAAVRGKKARELAEENARIAREQEAERQAEAERSREAAREQAERQAQALETTAAVTIAQPTTVVVHKGRGISTPKKWVGEVTDKLALMQFIVEKRPDLAVLFDVNSTALNAQVKLMGAGTHVPGITVREQTSISVR